MRQRILVVLALVAMAGFAAAAPPTMGWESSTSAAQESTPEVSQVHRPAAPRAEWNEGRQVSTKRFLKVALRNKCVYKGAGTKESPDRASACFVGDGDQIWVRDNHKDGKAAVAWWQIETRKGKTTRIGGCLNRHGVDTAALCNKNFVEDHVIWLRAGYWAKQPLTRANLRLGTGCWLKVSSGALYPPGCGDLY